MGECTGQISAKPSGLAASVAAYTRTHNSQIRSPGSEKYTKNWACSSTPEIYSPVQTLFFLELTCGPHQPHAKPIKFSLPADAHGLVLALPPDPPSSFPPTFRRRVRPPSSGYESLYVLQIVWSPPSDAPRRLLFQGCVLDTSSRAWAPNAVLSASLTSFLPPARPSRRLPTDGAAGHLNTSIHISNVSARTQRDTDMLVVYILH